MQKHLRHAGPFVLCLVTAAALLAAVRASTFDPNAACVGRSRELSLALMQYVQDYDERFPSMSTPAEFKAAVLPYTGNKSAEFICPAKNKPYAPNGALSGQTLTQFDPATTVAFQDSVAHSDGLKTATYLDGTVTRGAVVQGDPTLLCMKYAHDLAVATVEYAQDHNQTLPPTDTQADFQAAILPYVEDQREFTCPVTGDLFIPNPAIGGQTLGSISKPHSQVEVVEDAAAHPDGFSTIAYLDGHATHGSLTADGETCAGNARQLMLGVSEYAQDNGVLPPTNRYTAFESALSPYITDPSVFLCPDSGLPFVLNKSAGGQAVSSFPNPSTTVFLKAPMPDSNGVHTIGYVDGHVATKAYRIVRTMAVGSDNSTRLVLFRDNNEPQSAEGNEALWTVDANGAILSRAALVPLDADTVSAAVEPDSTARLFSIDRRVAYPNSAFDIIGAATLTTVNTAGHVGQQPFGPFDGWTPIAVGAGASDEPAALWDYYDGTAAVWLMSSVGTYVSSVTFSPPSGGKAIDLAVGADNGIRLLWADSGGSATVQTLDSSGISQGSFTVGAVSGKSPTGLIVDPSGKLRILWTGMDGSASVSTTDSSGSVTGQQDFAAQAGWHAVKIGEGGDGNLRILWLNVNDTARLDIVRPDGTLFSSQTFAPSP